MFYLYFAIRNYRNETLLNHFAAAFFLLLACLSKLPFVVFGIISFIYFIQRSYENKFTVNKGIILKASIYPIFLLPAFFWYRWVMPGWGVMAFCMEYLQMTIVGQTSIGFSIIISG
jgi:hypothetical protein